MLKNIFNRSNLLFIPKALIALMLLCMAGRCQAQPDTGYFEKQEVVEEGDPPPPVNLLEEEDQTDDQGFMHKSEYDAPQYWHRRLPDASIRQMKEDEDFWYAKGDSAGNKKSIDRVPQRNGKQSQGQQPQNQPPPEYESSSSSSGDNRLSNQSWFQTLVWIIIVGGFAGAILWYLMSGNVGLFRRKDKANADAGKEEEEALSEDIFAINYQKEIDKAAARGDYRLAIRLMYLRLLKNMAEKNIIQYKQDRTNFDYLMQLHKTTYYQDFFRVTRHYEYSWYGKFEVSNEAYGAVRGEFDQLDKKAGY